MVTFHVKRAKRGRLRRGQWVAVIIGANGRNLFTSETMNNRADAVRIVETVIASIQHGDVREIADR